jgi:hypothetical protein
MSPDASGRLSQAFASLAIEVAAFDVAEAFG